MRQSAIDAAVAVEVRERDGFERGERDLVGPQRTRERMPREQRDEIGATDDDPGLRSAEQLVARERHERGAGVEALPHTGLVAEPRRSLGEPRCALVEEPGTRVDDHRRSERRELGRPVPPR